MGFTIASVLLTTSVGISTMFLYCYFGQSATANYEMMADCVFNMEWYKHPTKLQKHFILMIANMQKPIYYHGFYVARMDLNTFVRVSCLGNWWKPNALTNHGIFFFFSSAIQWFLITWRLKPSQRNKRRSILRFVWLGIARTTIQIYGNMAFTFVLLDYC